MEEKSLPWYRYPWVWFIIAIPAASVVASMITLSIALQNSPELVTPDDTGVASAQERAYD